MPAFYEADFRGDGSTYAPLPGQGVASNTNISQTVYGLIANRPAANAVQPGFQYFSTDTTPAKLSVSDGISTWTDL